VRARGAKYTTITCGSMQINCAGGNNASLTLVGSALKVYATVISEPELTGLSCLEVCEYVNSNENYNVFD